MTLEVLSSIKGAKSSEAVDQLFEVIKTAQVSGALSLTEGVNIVSLDDLRPDEVIESSETEKNIIRNNFPSQKNGYLVVSKVIEE